MALKAAVSVTRLPSPPLRCLLSLASSKSAAARRLARVSAAMAVQPAVVVGGGRVGQALLSMGPPGADVLVGRGEKVPNDAPGPILVCTRNDDLDAVLDAAVWWTCAVDEGEAARVVPVRRGLPVRR